MGVARSSSSNNKANEHKPPFNASAVKAEPPSNASAVKATHPLSVYVIGKNQYGEAGINSTDDIHELTLFNQEYNQNLCVTSIQCGYGHTIYIDDTNNFWVVGFNKNGECGIGKFSEYISIPQQMMHFTSNNIDIKRICTNISSQTTFWITNNGETYGNGTNNKCQLGLKDNKNKNVSTPTLIQDLRGIIDVKSNNECSIAICSNYYEVLAFSEHFYRDRSIPDDILNIIRMFYKYNNVYSVSNVGGTVFSLSWRKIYCFNDIDKDIIKIETGQTHSLYLESNGILWSAGKNEFGQLGIGCKWSKSKNREPTVIEYFIINKIFITDIACGYAHNLVLDNNGCVYSWGFNKYRQTGLNINKSIVSAPESIVSLKDYVIDTIKCGSVHSYAKSKCGKHWLWGSNANYECLVFGQSIYAYIMKPSCINHTVPGVIKHVFLGYMNTKIIVLNNNTKDMVHKP